MNVVRDMIESLHHQGFSRFLVLNGHGGNNPIKATLYEMATDHPDIRIAFYEWWQSHSVEAILVENNLKSFHAGWIEAFPFTQVAELPDGEKHPPHVPGLVGSREAKEIYGDGVFGGLYKGDERIMDEIFQAGVADVLQLLKFD